MAFQELQAVGTVNLTARTGYKVTTLSSVIKDSAGTAIDFTTWNSVISKAVPTSPSFTGAAVSMSATTGNADGTVEVALNAADSAGKAPSQAGLIISGKKASGDEYQLLAVGQLTLLAGV